MPIYDGADCGRDTGSPGPALIDERDTTVWVPAGAAADGHTARDDRRSPWQLPSEPGGRRGESAQGRSDAIELELLRSQLQAVVEEAADTIERTAISPVVTESKDYSATLLDADGRPGRRRRRHHLPLGGGDAGGARHHRALRRSHRPG